MLKIFVKRFHWLLLYLYNKLEIFSGISQLRINLYQLKPKAENWLGSCLSFQFHNHEPWDVGSGCHAYHSEFLTKDWLERWIAVFRYVWKLSSGAQSGAWFIRTDHLTTKKFFFNPCTRGVMDSDSTWLRWCALLKSSKQNETAVRLE